MPMPETVDEETPFTGGSRASASPRGGLSSRPTIDETIDEGGARASVRNDTAERDEIPAVPAPRAMKASTQALIDKIVGAPATTTETTVDTETVDGEPAPEGQVDIYDGDLVEGAETAAEGETTEEETTEETQEPAELVEFRTKNESLLTANRRLFAENEALKKAAQAPRETPKLSEYHEALAAAEMAYVDQGTIPALKMFLSVITGAKPDSPEVAAELSGLFTDLTAQEIGVPLDHSARAVRDAAQNRLARARDKREQKAQTEAKPQEAPKAPDGVAQATTFIGNQLQARQGAGRSHASDYPRLMTFAKRIDGLEPAELIARVIQRELQAGNLKPTDNEDVMIDTASKIIENHYDAFFDELDKAKPKKPDTTSGAKPPAPATASKDQQRQSKAAPPITNAKASVAPATPPKKKPAAAPQKKMTDKERLEWSLRHIPK